MDLTSYLVKEYQDRMDTLRDAMAREPNADGAAAEYAMILELAGQKGKHHGSRAL